MKKSMILLALTIHAFGMAVDSDVKAIGLLAETNKQAERTSKKGRGPRSQVLRDLSAKGKESCDEMRRYIEATKKESEKMIREIEKDKKLSNEEKAERRRGILLEALKRRKLFVKGCHHLIRM